MAVPIPRLTSGVLRRTWVDPGTGSVVSSTLGVRHRIPLRTARIALAGNGRGGLDLTVERRRTIRLPVTAAGRVHSPETLRLLAEQLVRHAPHAREVVVQLRHLDTTRARLGR